MALGSIELTEFKTATKMPQNAASAWSWFDSSIVGCGYKPIVYLGRQLVHGVNYVFIAEQTPVTLNPVRRVVKLAINELNGDYSIVKPIEIIA